MDYDDDGNLIEAALSDYDLALLLKLAEDIEFDEVFTDENN